MVDNALSDKIPKRPDQMYSCPGADPQCFCNNWGKSTPASLQAERWAESLR